MKTDTYTSKKVFIIGGSTGIGLAIAKIFVMKGADIALFARRENLLNTAARTCETLKIFDDQIICQAMLDVSDPALTNKVLSYSMSHFGSPDILVNAAGRAIPRTFDAVSYQQFDETMKINLYGIRNTIASVLSAMKRNGGLIVNISSLAGLAAVYGYSDYCAAKFAVIGFSEVLRSELRPYGITVKVLCPSDTDTPGFKTENSTKPKETIEISKTANLMTADEVAVEFFKGIQRKQFLIVPGVEGKALYLIRRLFPEVIEKYIDGKVKKVQQRSSV